MTELANRVIEAFAGHTGLALCALDRDGRHIASADFGASRGEWLANRARERLTAGHRADAISLVDVLPGLKMFLAPINAADKPEGILAAGMVMEAGSRDAVAAYLAAGGERTEEEEAMFAAAREIDAADKRVLTEQLKALARTLGLVVGQARQPGGDSGLLGGIERLATLINDGHDVGELLQSFIDLGREDLKHGFDFVGFAEMIDDECVITHMAGNPEAGALVGTSCMIGEGFIGQAVATGVAAAWQDVRHDPRVLPFQRAGLEVGSLICCPVVRQGRVQAVLFAGVADGGITRMHASLASILSNMADNLRIRNERLSAMTKQSQRISALKEILHLMTKAKDTEIITYMLVDMSLNLLSGRFSAIALFDPDESPDEMRIVSRGLSREESEQYGKMLLAEYGHSGAAAAAWDQARSFVRETEWGTVLECPIGFNHKLLGVLSVATDASDAEAGSFLAALAVTGAVALDLLGNRARQFRDNVRELHEAAAALNPSVGTFSAKLREEAEAFARYLELPDSLCGQIGAAALVIGYSPELCRRVLPTDEPWLAILKEGRRLMESTEPVGPEEEQSLSAGGKILGLAVRYLQAGGDVAKMNWHRDSDLFAKFGMYKRAGLVQDRQIRADTRTQPDFDQLSKREQEVFLLLVEGMNNRQIADTLFISEHTVKNHITNIFGKLGIRDRAEAMAYYYRMNR
jgi:DNA-binding CsgD family transcriptional regulator/putative methionine-R-sulfoxide reductase with GAF domain